MTPRHLTLLVLCLLGASARAHADEGEGDGDAEAFPPAKVKLRAHATKTARPIQVDGKLDEAEWAQATPLSDFLQVEPHQRAPATVRTVVRVLFDEKALYIGARCEDPEGSRGLQQRDLRRDFDWSTADAFGITLDTLGDGRNAFGFFVNPWGAQLDLQVIDDQLYEDKWDTVWGSAVTRDDGGWTVELAIPWKSLRTVKGLSEWGFNVVRSSRRLNEMSVWSPHPRTYSPFRMSYAGVLDGFTPPDPQWLDGQLRPYAIARIGRVGDAPFSVAPTVGGEATWQPTAQSVLDVTANTDFAETDVDQRVVNLGRFSVYFPERRQFFLESAGVFASGEEGFLQPFFSRRIGLSDDGVVVPINAGGRFVWRDTQRSAGALVVNTAPVDGVGGSLFALGRYTHNLGDESRAGGMLVFRQDFAKGSLLAVSNLVPVVDGLFRSGPLTVSSTLMGSVTQTEGQAAKLGGAGNVTLQLQGNWGGLGGTLDGLSPDFDARAGFISRTEVATASTFYYLDLRPKWLPSFVRSMGEYGEAYQVRSTRTGAFEEANVYWRPLYVHFKHGDSAYVDASHSWQVLTDEFAPVPGVNVPVGHYQYDTLGFGGASEPSRIFSANARVKVGRYFRADFVQAQGGVSFSPVPHVLVAGSYQYNHFDGQDVQAGGAQTHLILGEARLSLNPKLQLISSYQRDTAGNVSVLNARIAWEFLPLSFLYLVFTDTRQAFAAVDAPVREQRIVLKATYTWRL
jgi:hypothetical protein